MSEYLCDASAHVGIQLVTTAQLVGCHTDEVDSAQKNPPTPTREDVWKQNTHYLWIGKGRNKWNHKLNLDRMLKHLLRSAFAPRLPPCHWISPVALSGRESGPQNLTRWPPACQKANKSDRLCEARTGQVTKHTHVISGHFPNIHSHTAEQFTQR